MPDLSSIGGTIGSAVGGPIGGAIGQIGGSLLGGLFGRDKAKEAARLRAEAFSRAMTATGEGYDRAQEFLDPRLSQEGAAMDRVNTLLGLTEGPVDFDVFRNTPGYQFALDQGRQAIERSAAARGGLASGNTLAALTEFGQGLADQTFNNYLNRVIGLQNQGADRASANLATDRANRIADLTLGQGGVRASGVEDSANQTLNMLGGITEGVGQLFGSFGNGGDEELAPITVPARYMAGGRIIG